MIMDNRGREPIAVLSSNEKARVFDHAGPRSEVVRDDPRRDRLNGQRWS